MTVMENGQSEQEAKMDDTKHISQDDYSRIAKEVVKHFPDEWVWDEEANLNIRYLKFTYLDMAIFFRCGGCGNHERFEISGGYPEFEGHRYKPKDRVKITCSVKREVKAIAKDIMNRFYYQYRRAFEETRAQMYADRAERERRNLLMQGLASIFEGSVIQKRNHLTVTHFGIGVGVADTLCGKIIVSCASSTRIDDQVKISIESLPYDLGIELLTASQAIMKSYQIRRAEEAEEIGERTCDERIAP